ncbi:MAG TPA: NADP-dependent phosphogluconate dehydrogenase [Fimbriimonadaceae bacterium]|nr:NADP-dependent phosphogluconate dehydrogenase [Fimbriimonadaceae bacterium]
MGERLYDFGMVGLGTMGRSLLLNMADHGDAVAGLDTDPAKAAALKEEGAGKPVEGTTDPKAFVSMLRKPRAIMMLVPAGAPVDSVIGSLSPMLDRGDILIDGGNSYFKDTDRRFKEMAAKGLEFLGVGVSGGEAGARHGPSMMPGGTPQAYERVRKTLEAVAAKYNGEPCVALLGPGSAGHYVKMVHNGIEYGVMQLIAETYDFMRRGLGMTNEQCRDTFAKWNEGPLQSFLIEITATVLGKMEGDKHLVDLISDKAKQKGTGKWTSQDAMDLGVPLPTIDAAVAARELSGLKDERVKASQVLTGFPRDDIARKLLHDDLLSDNERREGAITAAGEALRLAILITYAQGFSQLRVASVEYGFSLNLETVAKVWRAGCIIRSSVLERIRAAYGRDPDLPNLLIDEYAAAEASRSLDLRLTFTRMGNLCLPAPCFGASIAYLDGYRTANSPANLIQAQRDYFGAHTYERIDKPGIFHTSDWDKN